MAEEWLEANLPNVPGIVIKIARVANVFIRLIAIEKAGTSIATHEHPFDHSTVLSSGKVQADVDGQLSIFTAPAIMWVKAGKKHRFTALEDNTVFTCIHALRTGAKVEDIIDPDMIPAQAGVFPPGATPVVNLPNRSVE